MIANSTKYPDMNCKNCLSTPETTNHLFNCPVIHTELTPDALWNRPEEVAQLLGLEII